MIHARTAGFRRHVFPALLILVALTFLLGAAQADASHRCGHKRACTPPVDTTPPETTITSGPSGTVGSNSVSFGFSSSESGSTFECRLDTSSWAACSSPKSYSGLAGGSHTFNVRAKDAAGNIDASPASRIFAVDVSPPYSVSASPSSVASGETITVSWNVTGDTSTTDWVGIFKQSDASDGSTLGEWYYTNGAKTGSKTFTAPSEAGTYDVRYLREDGFTEVSRSGPITVTAASSTSPPPPAPSTSSPPPVGGWFATVLPGQFDYTITDAQAAAKVHRSSWEPRPQNRTANNTVAPADFAKPNDGWGWNWDKTYGRITGNFTGTTDEIIQWVAAKWGIADEIIRAMLINETYWYQNLKDAGGNPVHSKGYGDYGHCPSSQVGSPYGDAGPASFGLSQVKWCSFNRTDAGNPANTGGYPWIERSSAYAMDVWAATVRRCYEGWSYLGDQAKSDIWGCVGRWFSGDYNPGQQYVTAAKEHHASKPWRQAGF